MGDANARILLMFFRWNIERILTEYFDRGRDAVFKAAGIATELVNDDVSQGTVMCEACMDDVAISDTTMLRCGHRFCNDCWTTYISIKIKEGESKNITCMMDKCKVKFDEALIPWCAAAAASPSMLTASPQLCRRRAVQEVQHEAGRIVRRGQPPRQVVPVDPALRRCHRNENKVPHAFAVPDSPRSQCTPQLSR